ncbi:hypothetical protein D9M69_573240 [compost metagenome]
MLSLTHHIHLQPRHVAECHGAPDQHGGQREPRITGGESQQEQHGGEQGKDDFQGADRAALVRQFAAPDVADGHGDAVDQQHQADGAGAEAGEVLKNRREEGKGNERAAVADGRHRIHQQQAWLLEHLQLLQQ